MNARDAEAYLLLRCVEVAQGRPESLAGALAGPPGDEREANVFRVAAMLARPRHPVAAGHLRSAADRWFVLNPADRQPVEEIIRRGWIIGLPRFRELLDDRLDVA